MQCVLHVQALPGSIEGKEHNIPGLRQHADQIQQPGNRNSSPFRNEGPTLFASLVCNLRTRRLPLQFFQRKGSGTGNQAVDPQTPVGKPFREQTPVVFAFRRVAADGENLRDFATINPDFSHCIPGWGNPGRKAECCPILESDEKTFVRFE